MAAFASMRGCIDQGRQECLKRLVASPLLGLSIELSQSRLFKDNFLDQVLQPCVDGYLASVAKAAVINNINHDFRGICNPKSRTHDWYEQ